MRKHTLSVLEQEGRLDALKLDYPKKDLQFEQVENKPNILVITVSGYVMTH